MADRGAGCRHLWRLGDADLFSCGVAGLAGRRDRRLADRLALLAAARDRPLPSDALAAAQQRPRLRAAIAVAALCAVSDDASRASPRRGAHRSARRSGIVLSDACAVAAAQPVDAGSPAGADDAA